MFAKSGAKVRWQGQLGRSLDSTHGVLQGGIVSPKLFNLFLSDMSDYFEQRCGVSVNGVTFTHLLYADDLVLVSEDADGMQVLLDNLADYCRKWHLLINSQKSKVMIINPNRGNRAVVNNRQFSIENETLEIVDSYKYLGHIFCNSTRTHNMMHDHLATQAQRAMHALKERVKSTVGYLSPKVSLKMFDSHILPILDYTSEIWFSAKEIDVLERIQLKFLKNLLGVRHQTSTVAVLADTGRFPLLYRQQASAIKYWGRLTSDSCPPLLRRCYDIQLSLYQNRHPCWLTRIHQVTDGLATNDQLDSAAIIVRLYNKAHANMLSDINDSNKFPKLRTYKLFKVDLRVEPYLNLNLSSSLFRSIARFRLSSHNLHIELGRHKRPFVLAENRTCKRCNMDVIEDEFHCLMICEKWDTERKDLFETACRHIENFLVLHCKVQFIKILDTHNSDVIYALGKFLRIVLKTDNIV